MAGVQNVYSASKVMAERSEIYGQFHAPESLSQQPAAWQFMEAHKHEIGWDMTVIVPPMVGTPQSTLARTESLAMIGIRRMSTACAQRLLSDHYLAPSWQNILPGNSQLVTQVLLQNYFYRGSENKADAGRLRHLG